jgi:hypothetical protein
MIGEILHGGAVVASAVGVCCVAVPDRSAAAAPQRGAVHRARGFAIALGMLIAMIGAGTAGPGWAAPWSAAIVVLAFGSLLFGRRAATAERGMIAYDALGAVIMAALVLVMGVGTSASVSAASASAAAGHHGAAPLALAIGLGVATLAYAGLSGFVMSASRDLAGRLRPLAMGSSVLLMGFGALSGV